MENKAITYVIIGNGIAAMSAAEEIRKADKDGIIKMISDEGYLPYYRIKLSHFISKDPSPKDLLIHDGDWYKDRGVDMVLGKKAISIDPEKSKILLDDGQEIPYDKLLIANGSSSFIPPVEGAKKQGVYTLRNIQNLKEIQEYAKDCKSVSVIGGGLLGLEAAWALKERGLRVDVIEFFPYLLPRQLDEELSIYLKEKLEKNHIQIHLGAATEEIVGDHRVRGIRLKDGRMINTDMVLFSTGVRPNINIVKGTRIEANKGIILDRHMKTTVENIYGAGDVGEFNGVVMGLWPVAMNQGKIAGKNMTGSAQEYTLPQPAASLTIGDISLFSVGEINKDKDRVVFKENENFYKLFLDQGRIIGGVLMGDTRKMAKVKGAVSNKIYIGEMIKEGMNALEVINSL